MLLFLAIVILLLALGGGIFWHPILFALVFLALGVAFSGRRVL